MKNNPGPMKHTLVAFSSDNGPENTGGPDQKGTPGAWRSYYSLGDIGGLRGRKRRLYEGGVRTPFILRWPGHAPSGVKNESTVFTAVDLLPTFCAAAGLTPPADANGDGENLLEAFNGKPVLRTRPIFWRYMANDLAVRDGDWKLVTNFDGTQTELHNLKSDRAEDAAKDQAKKYPEITARLTKMVFDWNVTLPTEVDPTCVNPNKGKRSRQTGAEED